MTDRRSLVEGLKQSPAVDPLKEKEFVFQNKQPTSGEGATTSATPPTNQPAVAKAPLSTRIRADLASALKRASLERQLSGIEPHTVQDILEAAIEPWLKTSGYLP